jgi:hypothetical protein
MVIVKSISLHGAPTDDMVKNSYEGNAGVDRKIQSEVVDNVAVLEKEVIERQESGAVRGLEERGEEGKMKKVWSEVFAPFFGAIWKVLKKTSLNASAGI